MPEKSSSEALLNAAAPARHSALLSLEVAGADRVPPKEVRLFKMGKNDSQQGEFYFSERSAKTVMERAKDWGNEFHFDWDHHAYLTMSKGVKAPAAAWYQLELRDDGLWAKDIKWTPQGEKDIKDGSYRYLSPYFDFDSTTREVTQFNNAALTNLPALKQLEALTSIPAQGEGTNAEVANMERKALLSALGLPENATDADIAAKTAALQQFKAQMLSSTGAKSEFEAMSALLSMKASADKAAQLEKDLEKQKADAITKEREALLSAAVEAGQLEPGGDLKKQLETQPVEMVKAMLSALPKKPGAKSPAKAGDKPGGAGASNEESATLSQEQMNAAKKSATWFDGVKSEDIQKHWAHLTNPTEFASPVTSEKK